MSFIMRLFLIFILLFPCTGLAQDELKCPEKIDARKQIIDSKEYVCFDTDSARCLLQEHIDYPKLKLDLKRHKELVVIKDKQINVLTNANTNLTDQIDIQGKEIIRLTEVVEDSEKWYKNSYLWFGIGVLAGVGTTVAILYAVKEI
jgi:hypothetical protein